MNSLGQAISRQCSLRTSTAVGFTILLCLALPHEAIAGKAGTAALKLLGQLAFAVVSGTATAVASDEAKKRLNPEPNKTDISAAPSRENPAQPANRPPQPSPAPQPVGYTFTLTWLWYDSSYIGTLVIQGTSGIIRVRNNKLGVIIDQDISVTPYGRDVWLVGSNPRYMDSTVPALNYYPDNFRLIQTQNGEWRLADMCSQGLCSPVDVIEASTF